NVWLISFNGVTQTRRVVVKCRFIHALINICSSYVISNLSYIENYIVVKVKIFTLNNHNSFKKVLIWPLLIIIISFFAFCALDHSSDDRPFGKQVYVEKYMPIPKDYKPVTPVVLPEEDYTYDKIYSHFRGVLDCRFISIEHSQQKYPYEIFKESANPVSYVHVLLILR
ncbi:19760_t:CDS:2, partial [Racocetra persica]